jgi:hypothetical protein
VRKWKNPGPLDPLGRSWRFSAGYIAGLRPAERGDRHPIPTD